eukprot:ANDGO_01980.mRNA.1 hypothetical protein
MDQDYAVVAGSITDDLVSKSLDAIVENEYRSRVVPFLVQSLTEEILSALSMSFLPCEGPLSSTPTWNLIDEEPSTVLIDSWARGALPVRTKPKPSTPPTLLESSSRARTPISGGRPTRTPSPSSMDVTRQNNALLNSSLNGSNHNNNGNGSNRGGVGGSSGSGSGNGKNNNNTQSLRKSAIEKSSMNSAKNGKTGDGDRLRSLLPSGETPEIPAHLKGKDYTYDHQGRIVEIANVDVEKLPSSVVNPKIQIKNAEDASAADDANALGKRSRTSGANASSASITQKKKLAAAQSSVVKSEGAKFVEPVEPLPGVVIRDGGTTKVGPPKEKDKYHMTRKDYLSTTAVVNQQITRTMKERQTATAKHHQTLASLPASAQAQPGAQQPHQQQQGSSAFQDGARGSSGGQLGALRAVPAVKSRKDRSVFAPYASSGDEFALMRKQASLMRAAMDGSVPSKPTPAQDRTIVANMKLAQDIMNNS